MNIDKLKALIRLANNNPNEHEANLAARKVCKQLAGNDFALLKEPARTSNTAKPAADTWNSMHRSKEPFWRSGDPLYDFFVNFKGGRRDAKSWTEYAPHVDAPEDNDYEPFYKPPRNQKEDEDWIRGKRKRRQEIRICSKCGLETMTFRTDEVPWICNPCHWKEKNK